MFFVQGSAKESLYTYMHAVYTYMFCFIKGHRVEIWIERRQLVFPWHCNDVMMSAMASQITGVSIVCSTICSGADQRKHRSSPPLAIVRGIHRWPVDSPHKGPVTGKVSLFDDVIMGWPAFERRRFRNPVTSKLNASSQTSGVSQDQVKNLIWTSFPFHEWTFKPKWRHPWLWWYTYT